MERYAFAHRVGAGQHRQGFRLRCRDQVSHGSRP